MLLDLSDCPNCFEDVAHYQELWHKDHWISETVGQYSISPKKRFAILGESGKRILFDANSRTLNDVTDGSFAVPSDFEWHESARRVTLRYSENHGDSSIKLPN